MKGLLKGVWIILIVLAVAILTVLTQIGGIVLLVSILVWVFLRKRFLHRGARIAAKSGLFVGLYLITTFLIIPLLAPIFGRVQLPPIESNHVRPLTFWTAILNRNYVRPKLRQVMFEVAEKINEKYPGTSVNYLDSGFPFIDKVPLPPHLSHSDGKKVDIALYYRDRETGKQTNDAPSFIGYGVYEEPAQGEPDFPTLCASKGYKQYSLLKSIMPQGRKENFTFDGDRTSDLVTLFARETSVSRIFIEPHLRERLHLRDFKIRFHGCNAVRHDDHIHVQIN